MRPNHTRIIRYPRAFTLIEILIVVIILGILAGIVIASFGGYRTDAEDNTFCTNMKTYVQLFTVYFDENSEWPLDKLPGQLPPEMNGRIDADEWARTTPIGGQWDWDYNVFSVTAGISVKSPKRTDAEMLAIDKVLDDGDLSTGAFRKRSGGFIYIIDP